MRVPKPRRLTAPVRHGRRCPRSHGLFVYGYYDEVRDMFVDAICVTLPELWFALSDGKLEYERHFNRKKQSFLAFRFENLDAAGVVRFWMRKQEGELSVLGGAAASGS